MSFAYNQYLDQHTSNVCRAYEWFKTNLPEVIEPIDEEFEWAGIKRHDESKYSVDEYEAYDAYFYGNKTDPEVEDAFNLAWLHHIHINPHHWQHYVLINDDPKNGIVALDMPYHYIVEMICDWWSFSLAAENSYEIFEWYKKHKTYMKLSYNTRKTVEDILDKIASKLIEVDDE